MKALSGSGASSFSQAWKSLSGEIADRDTSSGACFISKHVQFLPAGELAEPVQLLPLCACRRNYECRGACNCKTVGWGNHLDLRTVPTIVTAHIFCAYQGSRSRREGNAQHAGHAEWFCLS